MVYEYIVISSTYDFNNQHELELLLNEYGKSGYKLLPIVINGNKLTLMREIP